MPSAPRSVPGAPAKVPGAPHSVPGAPLFVPGGPTRAGLVENSKIQSGYRNFLTTVSDQDSSGEWRDIHTKQIRDFQGRYAGAHGIAWQGLDTLSEGLFEYGKRVEGARDEAMRQLANDMVQWARSNHVWENETGDAERGLHAETIIQGTRAVVWLGHGVPYGIWLEIMQNGRFAIILPTILKFGAEVGGRVAAHV